MKNKKALIRYAGAKWRLADWIISYFPEHKSYLEPFFGSGAVLFSKERSNIETVNDLDGDVVNFFSCIQKDPEKLAERNLSSLFGPRPRDHKSLRLMPPEFVDDVMHPLWKTGFSGVLNLEVFSVEDFTASHAVLMQSWERYAASS